MNSNFERIIKHILHLEGGWVDNPNDPGGATNKGISYRFIKQNGIPLTITQLKNLTDDEAKRIYYDYFWKKGRWHLIEDYQYSWVLAIFFDMAINTGNHNAVKYLQKTINDYFEERLLAEDGVLGNKTKQALFKIDNFEKIKMLSLHNRVKYYVKITRKQYKFITFMNGWINRVFYWGKLNKDLEPL